MAQRTSSSKKRMTPVDASFIHMERHESPQHGSVLIVFQIPDGAPATYIRELAGRMRQHSVTAERFNYVLAKGLVDRLAPVWEVLPPEEIELDYHFRHSALPAPGGELELGLVVSRLVTHPLDPNRPMWEIHLIEGLENNRFALFMKMSHALVDGMTMMRTVRNWLSADPTSTDVPPLWAMSLPPREMKSPAAAVPRSPSSMTSVVSALGTAVSAARGNGNGLQAPYSAPHTVFNRKITQRRRISTQQLEIARVRRIADAIDGTVNDAIAVVVGGALRQYLGEIDALPDRTLVAGVLASLRAVLGEAATYNMGNAISFIFADLATDTDDVAERAVRVTRSTRAGKEHLFGLKSSAMTYSTLMLLPLIVTTATGTGHRLPIYNVGLSNVPGSDVPLYWNGARAEALHATTIIANGQALIATVTSWDGRLCFTFTACPDSVPHPQHLAVLLPQALADVEQALGL